MTQAKTQTQAPQEETQTVVKWKSIKVPQGLYERISELAEASGKPKWQVIAEGIECKLREGRRDWRFRATCDLDRVSYYIMKLMTSVERFKLNPNEENLVWLEKTAKQIMDRLGVDVSLVVSAAKRYMKTKSKEDYVDLNMMAKMAISDIIYKRLLSGEAEGGP